MLYLLKEVLLKYWYENKEKFFKKIENIYSFLKDRPILHSCKITITDILGTYNIIVHYEEENLKITYYLKLWSNKIFQRILEYYLYSHNIKPIKNFSKMKTAGDFLKTIEKIKHNKNDINRDIITLAEKIGQLKEIPFIDSFNPNVFDKKYMLELYIYWAFEPILTELMEGGDTNGNN